MFLSNFVKADPAKNSILPLGVSFKGGKQGGYKRKQWGTPSKLGLKLYQYAAEGVLLDYKGEMIIVQCDEHKCQEAVFVLNYEYDLRKWYRASRHPRFSIAKALLEAKQIHREIRDFIGTMGETGPDPVVQALKISDTPREFIKNMDAHLFRTLRIGRRRIRVTRRMKEKYEAKSFTVADFFREENQEMRRVIARILPVKDILKNMKRLAKDKEGTLYEYTTKHRHSWRRQHRTYLHVICPSTAQEYLLQVPDRFEKPKDARRWTFNLPAEAEFSKEA